METRPPEVIEKIVQWLVPPASREHVLGDLRERFVSPRQYVLDVLRTVPFVVASRIRRTTNPGLSVLFATLFFVATAVGQGSWWAPVLTAATAVVVLALRDAYRKPATKAVRAAAMDTACVLLGIFLSQGLLAFVFPGLSFSREALEGLAVALVLLLCMRLQTSGFNGGTPPARSVSREELLSEVRHFESAVRRAIRLEWAACMVVGGFFGMNALQALQTFELAFAIGSVLVVAGAVFVGWFLYKHQPRPIPGHLEFGQTVDAYRMHLQRGVELSSTYLWWYLLPLSPGLAVLLIGAQVQNMNSLFPSIMVVGMILLGGLLLLIQRGARRKYQKRIDELAILEEKPQTSNAG